jgi:hypothetical protein
MRVSGSGTSQDFHLPDAVLKAILSSSLVKVKGSLLTTEEANAAIVKAGLSCAQNLLMAS